MKKIKAIVCVLALAMTASVFAGCSKTSKVSAEKFEKACEKLKLEEFEFDGDAPKMDDLEDGIYAVADDDVVEKQSTAIASAIKKAGLDIDADGIVSFGLAAKATGLEDAKDSLKDPEDLAEVKIDGAFAFQVTFKKEKQAMDVMEAIEDTLKSADIRVKDLSSKEYYSGKNEGYLRFHIDIAKLAKLILENDDIADALDEAGKKSKVDYEELLGSLKGDIAIAVEVSGTDVFIIAGGALNQKADTLNKFASTFGATNPVKVPMNEKICKEALDGAIETYISKAKAAMAKVSAGNNTTTETETDDDE